MDFRSVCRRQIEPVIIMPHRAKIINGYASSLVRGVNITIIRIMPYPPSFSKTAASTIEPAMGASTWAFGSHKCTPYSGIFTRKARMQPAHQILFPHVAVFTGL